MKNNGEYSKAPSLKRWVKKVFLVACLPVVCVVAQVPSQPDTTYVFTPVKDIFRSDVEYRPYTSAWGIDLMLSDNGFGLGGFYRSEITSDWSWGISFAISSAKDPTEVEQYDYYGDSYVYGKKNRLLMFPLHITAQYRLFRDDITDSFRPFLSAGIGPTMMYVFPYARNTLFYDPWLGETFLYPEKTDFFTSLKYGKMHYTLGGFLGAGAYFGLGRNTLTGVSIRYYFAYYPNGIEVMEGSLTRNFSGIALLIQFGASY